MRSIHNRTLTVKRLFLNSREGAALRLRGIAEKLRSVRLREASGMLLLFLLLLYGTAYFSFNALELHSYGFSDQYTHHAWIYAMEQGKIYPKGIYPEGMHCMVYTMSYLFGIRPFYVILFLGGIHSHAVLLSAFLMMRELFSWKVTPYLALAAFLMLFLPSSDGLYAMSRLAATLPQEFAFPAMFLLTAALLRLLKRKPAEHAVALYRYFLPSCILGDEDLLIFFLGIAVTICVHFYATIMAFFLCAVVFLSRFLRGLRKDVLLRLVLGVVYAVTAAALPFVIAFALGYPLQGSLNWAVAVTRGGEEAWAEGRYDAGTDYLKEETKKEHKL